MRHGRTGRGLRGKPERVRVAAVAVNQTPLDWVGNGMRIREAVNCARQQGAQIVVLPELCLCGYGCEDAFFLPSTAEHAWQSLEDLKPRTQGLVVVVGLPIRHEGALFNASAVLVNGEIEALVAKQHLAGDGIHYEPRWFKPWPVGVVDEYRGPEGGVPIGNLVVEVGGVRLGLEICEDAWVAQRPGALLAARGVELIVNPSASHFAFGKSKIRRRLVEEGSRAFGAVYVYANLLGNEAGRILYDGQLMIAEEGRILAESRRFGFQDSEILTATVNLRSGRLAMAESASYFPQLGEDRGRVRVEWIWPEVGPERVCRAEPIGEEKMEEFTRAVALGLFDYLRKSGARGYVVSLSGGADSSAAACLVRLMWEMAHEELEGRIGEKLPVDRFEDLLLTAYQATENSGQLTRNAAREVATAIGSCHRELEVEAIRQAYVAMVESAVGETLDWEHHDVALQNVQARVRSPGIWMLANLRGAILLSTSNRSEAAVGYATMDGDTSGGLAPISGIDKAFLREWLKWLELTGPVIGGRRRAIPELALVNRQEPTAELRPPGCGQTDEVDLMPYPVLDFIERAFLCDRQDPEGLLDELGVTFPEISAEQRQRWVEAFFRLWRRNQWKRERYAPCFHLDDENLDPKTFCRWPILSGEGLGG
ncbi:NAD+ synthase (glutamine-hydrolyzing) [Haloferula luteola]|uniref:Glutamine-dependent NAD(+) synthetase n=1 Tax=Haloferula luteola TaxID=595692 RepID=A0A840VCI8_9BACT|nr:NAD(+) synthase [Haloferula luteola]MBB5351519.1 NAD+ synthase (glutamine-hydrolyzing) [Haloferula luteola]